MYTVSGFRTIKYKTKDDREVDGVEFHLVDNEASGDSDFVGCPCAVVFISRQNISGDLSLDCLAELRYTVSRGIPRITGINLK